MKSSFVFTAEGRLNTKAKRQKDCANSRSQTIEPSYKNNSTKEELCLEYIHSFNTQFEKAYKNRKPPYITAKNEYGITKCVCTTLRPTLIPIPELYDMYECASFLAGYILYEPLDPQTEHPSHLFSPTQTLNSHTGDSYDFSVLLCSFLIGSGYDAYVMCGYAPRFITLKDQSMTKCPIPIDFENVKKSKSTEEIRKSDATISSTYIPPDNTVKSSKYLADVEEAKRLAALDTFKLWIPDDDLDEKKMMDQEKEADIKSKTKRNHAWVYVAPGKKEVKEGVFIESSTGRIYTIPNSPYMGIESVWNASNFWVNLVPDSAVNQVFLLLLNFMDCV